MRTRWNRFCQWRRSAICIIEALYTHFPSADENPDETRCELALFLKIVEALKERGLKIPLDSCGQFRGDAGVSRRRGWGWCGRGFCFTGFVRSNSTRVSFVPCSLSRLASLM